MVKVELKNLDFEKQHGLGNDYIIINDIKWQIPNDKKSLIAAKLCKQHYSIGADGLIFVCKTDKADIKMRIFNSDGSEAEMCGNGIRCFSKYVYENGIVKKTKIKIETLKGILGAELNLKGFKVMAVKVDMGSPILECEKVPAISTKGQKQCVDEPIEVANKKFNFTAVSMGNPHAVIFIEIPFNNDDLQKYGAAIEVHKNFPKKTNVEFVKVLSEQECVLKVFERSVGITNACGTGACASVVAGVLLGKFKKNVPVVVHNDGGNLIITYTGENVLMEGPVERAYSGIIEQIEI